MIQLEAVSKAYPRPGGDVRALDELSLNVEAGQFVAVRGPSGCGKTSLLMVVAGMSRPTSGRVTVAGHDMGAMNMAQRARFRAETIGFVFQLFHLLPYLDVQENVLVAATGSHREAKRRRAAELLEQFGLGHRLKHRPGELSAGERQRVALARALLNSPPILLADEPTGNLDPENAASVLDLLADFHRAGGTVLLVTHDELSTSYAQRTVLLRDGRIDAKISSGEAVTG